MNRLGAADVHATLKRYMLADGFPVVFDFEKSRGAFLHDMKSGRDYLDLFSFFASLPLGFNHPGMKDPEYLERLTRAASLKPTNSDVYSIDMASFVQTFAETCIPESHRHHLFFVEGGALAVENALKTAFDWKYRKNQAKGGPDTENLEVLHLRRAFHGRTGYTMSLTNTRDPRKYQYFPKFDWPRVDVPAARFPLEGANLEATAEAEVASVAQVEAAFEARKDRIAAIIVETIQGEGGDNHLRAEYLRELRRIADEREALLIFDEVQCGMGLTGRWWAWQGIGVEPDIFAFGKKAQVCGIAVNHRVDDVDSVFKIASRLNSTWGGGLVDMVRVERYIQLIVEHDLLANATRVGARVRGQLEKLAADSGKISNVRGRGLMIAFDLPDEDRRAALQKRLFENGVMMLPSGNVSMRFRPVLDLREEDGDLAVQRIAASL